MFLFSCFCSLFCIVLFEVSFIGTFFLFSLLWVLVLNRSLIHSYSYNVFLFNETRKVLISSFFFSLAHFSVLPSVSHPLLYPIVILPFFFSGLIYSRARIKLGLFWSFALHSMYNSMVVAMGFYAKSLIS